MEATTSRVVVLLSGKYCSTSRNFHLSLKNLEVTFKPSCLLPKCTCVSPARTDGKLQFGRTVGTSLCPPVTPSEVDGSPRETAQRAGNLTEIEGWDNDIFLLRHNAGQHQVSTLPRMLDTSSFWQPQGFISSDSSPLGFFLNYLQFRSIYLFNSFQRILSKDP